MPVIDRGRRVNLYGVEEALDAEPQPAARPNRGLAAQGDAVLRRHLAEPHGGERGAAGGGDAYELGTTNDNMPTALVPYVVPERARDGKYADDRGYTAGAEAKWTRTNAGGTEQLAAGLGGHMYTGLMNDPRHRDERQDETYLWLQKLWRDPARALTFGVGLEVDRFGAQGGLALQNRVHHVTGGALDRQLPQTYPDGGKITNGVGVMADVGIERPIVGPLSGSASAGATLGTQHSSLEGQAGLDLALPGHGRMSFHMTALREFDPTGRLRMVPDLDKVHIGRQLGITYPVLRQYGIELEVGLQQNGRAGEPATAYFVLRKIDPGGARHWLPRLR